MTGNRLIRIQPETLQAWLTEADTMLIDVREHTEYALEHIRGAQLMPLWRLDASALPRGKRIVLCCASGNRSQTAARRLGFEGIAHLEGGLAAWRAAGLPTVHRQPFNPASIERFQRAAQHA
jgi:rhodanese-related sulfurtransferase